MAAFMRQRSRISLLFLLLQHPMVLKNLLVNPWFSSVSIPVASSVKGAPMRLIVSVLAGMLATSVLALPVHNLGDGAAPFSDLFCSVGSGDNK
ncbi:MAG: hypothetical protein ED859_17840 [Desulfuromonadales bacterium]|nr:MAG: hypothetical protein ED859_17840 [Desulfuromonadales bacterium]